MAILDMTVVKNLDGSIAMISIPCTYALLLMPGGKLEWNPGLGQEDGGVGNITTVNEDRGGYDVEVMAKILQIKTSIYKCRDQHWIKTRILRDALWFKAHNEYQQIGHGHKVSDRRCKYGGCGRYTLHGELKCVICKTLDAYDAGQLDACRELGI